MRNLVILILLTFSCQHAHTKDIKNEKIVPYKLVIKKVDNYLPASRLVTADKDQIKGLISALILRTDNTVAVLDYLGLRRNFVGTMSDVLSFLGSGSPAMIANVLYKDFRPGIISEEFYRSDEMLALLIELTAPEKISGYDNGAVWMSEEDQYRLVDYLSKIKVSITEATECTKRTKELMEQYGARVQDRKTEVALAHALLLGDFERIAKTLKQYTNVEIDEEKLLARHDLEENICPKQCSVYYFMGHGITAGKYVRNKYSASMQYVSATGCELNGRQGKINAATMQEHIPGLPPQLWSYGIRYKKAGETDVGINPYYNAGYDPMLSFVLKPHKFTPDEYQEFLVDLRSQTPLLSNWGKYGTAYVASEETALSEQNIDTSIINSVGFMRMLQQVWLASIDKAISLTETCTDCGGVELVFEFGFLHQGESNFYSKALKIASTTNIRSERESLDYKILVLKDNINDGDSVVLPSGKTVVVPQGYVDNLKTNFPINHEKNLREDGSLKFEPIMCDESIGLKSLPEVLFSPGAQKRYMITKDNAKTILKSGCKDFFTVNKAD